MNLRRVLAAAIGLVCALGLAVELLRPVYRWPAQGGVVALLSLSYEGNLPSWFSSVLLLLAGGLCAVVAGDVRARGEPFRGHWTLLALGFVYISFDEVVGVHEGLSAWFPRGGVLTFSWVIPAGALVLVLLILYARFLWRLPRGVRGRVVLAGAVYVLGAVGMELPLGYWTARHGVDNLGYALIDWVEETLELVGVALFILALVDLLRQRGAVLRFGDPG